MTRRLFLRQAIRPAAAGDVQVVRDLANTLFAHLSECVGMAATTIGERSATDLFDHVRSTAAASAMAMAAARAQAHAAAMVAWIL